MPVNFEPVIGLEIHVQLSLHSKIFSTAPSEFSHEPNTNTSEYCYGLPGTLPVLNEKVVESAMLLGLATKSAINRRSQFARKHYFYPDLPKGYQISQDERPICIGGQVTIYPNQQAKEISLHHIHMEEDAGKLVHDPSGRQSLIDLNRAGSPLLEIVSNPVLQTPLEARLYMEKVRSLVVYLGISDANMEKGNLRCDANISLRPVGETAFGTRVEIKNLNSFRFLQQALDYEIVRQEDILNSGGQVLQETRLWNESKKMTYMMRRKEDSHDYRYFPDPDLPVVTIEQDWLESIEKSLPELPDKRMERFVNQYKMKFEDAESLAKQRYVSNYFENLVNSGTSAKLAYNWTLQVLTHVASPESEDLDKVLSFERLSELLQMIEQGKISSSAAKVVLTEMLGNKQSASKIAKDKGLEQVSNEDELSKMVQDIIAQFPDQLTQYREGKTKVFGFFVGQVMKASRGQANPTTINQLLKKYLD